MDNLENQIYCSGCQKAINIEDSRYPLARRKYICGHCYRACGFTVNTATNCLSEEDIKYMLALKDEYPEEGPVVEYNYSHSQEGEGSDKNSSDLAPELAAVSAADKPEDVTMEIPDITDEPADVTVDDSLFTMDEPESEKKKKRGFAPLSKALPRREDPLGETEKPKTPEPAQPPVSKGISARKYEESRDRTEDDYYEEVDPSQRKKNIIKIAAIIAVTLITIIVVGSFLPFSAFSNGNDVAAFTVIQGEENAYSQRPMVPKDGYIYNIPEGDYTVTMSTESTAAKGVVTVEGNTVLPSSTGTGYYENLETIELTPGESAPVTVEEGQHIYTSLNSVFTFEQQ